MACFVKNCKNIKRLLPPNSAITFHRFPADELMYRKWLEAIGRDEENKVRSRNMYLCSDHFCLDDFINGHGVRRIKKFVVPISNKFLEENIPSTSPKKKISKNYTNDSDLYLKQKNMGKCVVAGCINRSSKKSLEQLERESSGIRISFHKFPNSAEISEAWVNAIRRVGWSPGTYSTVCSDHFTDNCFDKSPFLTKLLPNSIPTIFPAAYDNRQVSINTETEIVNIVSDSMPEKQPLINETLILPSNSSVYTSEDGIFSKQLLGNGYKESLNTNKISNSTVALYRLKELKNRTSMYEKKIEILSRKNKQQQKTIATLRNILSVLKRKNKTNK